MRGAALAAGLAAAIGLAACGDDTVPPPSRTDLPYELYCDITNGDCQRTIYNSVAAKLGAAGLGLPRIRTISVEQHAEEMRRSVALDELTGEDPYTRGLRLMGFIPEASESLTATQLEFRINQIAAYYSGSDDMITVVDRAYGEVDAQALLAHEFVHAIQERQFGFDGIWAAVDTEDAVLGARSVIEGDANHTEAAWVYEKLGYLPSEIDWDAILDDSKERLGKRVDDPEVALVDTASFFPYSYGYAFMTELALLYGLDGRADAFESPPRSAFEVMTGPLGARPALGFPEVAHPAPPQGHTQEVENRFGAWYVYAFLRRSGLSESEAWATALSWRGDEFAVYDNGSEVAAVWRVRFDEAASVVRDAVNADQEGRAQTAVLYEDDVFVLAAESGPSLLAWAEQPLDSMTAALVLKNGQRRGGPVSVGTCLKSLDFSLPNPPPLLH
ncbi:MAG: hypothetical protein WCB63_14375 [Polyangiales bacterium]